MYAIVEIAGKQYKVKQGLTLHVDKLDVEEGAAVVLDKVLLVKTDSDLKIGMPYVEGATVSASVKDPLFKDKKIIVFHYKNKTGFHKKQGHRHQYTVLTIDSLSGDKPAKAAKAEKTEKAPKVETTVKAPAKVAAKPAPKVKAKAAPKKPAKKTTTK